MEKERVLFLCTGNSARSQMAEALLRKMAGDRFEVHSAGLDPSVIHPMTIQVLQEIGIDASGQYAKPLTTYLGKVHFSYLITVCSKAEQRCPIFPGIGQRLHWPFDDPAAFEGSEQDKLEFFRQVRDQIEIRIRQWLFEQESA
ncbi:MAG: arsenate reductase ArsC [Anaerolineae bacterium]|nr:arsenate reductase ArsC [Anaerolineae bacterium]